MPGAACATAVRARISLDQAALLAQPGHTVESAARPAPWKPAQPATRESTVRLEPKRASPPVPRARQRQEARALHRLPPPHFRVRAATPRTPPLLRASIVAQALPVMARLARCAPCTRKAPLRGHRAPAPLATRPLPQACAPLQRPLQLHRPRPAWPSACISHASSTRRTACQPPRTASRQAAPSCGARHRCTRAARLPPLFISLWADPGVAVIVLRCRQLRLRARAPWA